MSQQNEWLYEFRVWVLILKSALDVKDLILARNSIREIINIISEICYVNNLWSEEIERLERKI